MKVNQIISEMTSGCVSSIAMPIGNIKKRTTETTNVPGLKPAGTVSSKNKKKGQYANSVLESKTSDRPVQEAKLDEDDLILVPGQGMSRRTGFVKHDLDRAEHEGQTLKNSLHTIIRVATHLNKELSERDNFPEWVSEKIGNIKGMMVTVMDYLISDKEMHGQIQAHEMTGGVIAGGGVGESIIETGSYNPLDQERQEQNAMDWSKRQFKNKELQGELGHEDNPNFDRNRNRGPFYIKINGKILRTRGEIKVFDYLNGARNYGSAILKKRPELKGKVFITNSPKDDQGVEEGRFTVNRKTGARLHPRTGIELPPKEKPLTMKQMFSKGDDREPEFDVDLDDVWREFTIAASNVAPDIEPYEDIRFAQWLKNHGITDFKIGDVLDAAAKKHGYDSWSDYSDSIRQYARDNVAEAGHQSLHAKLAKLKATYDAALKSPNPNPTTLRKIRDQIIKLEFDLGLKEGAKVDRMVKHIAKSERELGKSKDEAENIAWATANKRGMLDNKNKKSGK